MNRKCGMLATNLVPILDELIYNRLISAAQDSSRLLAS